jgi:hypothetical protein
MASRPVDTDLVEHCSSCAEPTAHAARIELRTESSKEANAQYSREPYRVVECSVCGESSSQRMNDA